MKKQIALFSIVMAALVAVPAISRAQDTTNQPAATKDMNDEMGCTP